jgi:crotonobetainyl-CoA:carnitine CoA-transferase CaiB-like acyl-CoA transferase
MLKDVRVLEVARGLAGPVAGLLLAELGADVLKIEPPGGDPGRVDAAFASWNRSKRSQPLDLDAEPGRAELDTLLAGANVLIHDLTPSRAKALRLDDATLAANHPDLIVCSITGYPAGHRDEDRPADELLVQARVGLLDEQDGFRDGPIVYRYPIGGWGAAHLAASGVLARLIMRQKTGRGGAVNTSLLQGLLAPMSLVWSRIEKGPFSVRGPKPPSPNQTQMYQCEGGDWLQIMDPTGKLDFASLPLMWEVMAETGANIDSPEQRRAAFRTRPREAWLVQLRAADIAVEPATPLGEVLRHREAEANGYVVAVDDPRWGPTRQAAIPLHMSQPVTVRSPAPRLGEGGGGWSGASARAPAAKDAATDHPLSGLKVVDLGAFLAGPMAPSMMGDMGADVIKVEPITGDRMRFMTRYFHAAARSKRSIAVDLTRPEGQEILARLVRWADLVHHNMRIKAALKIGVDEAALRRLNPDLVYSYVSAYGLKGERANWPGYDSVFQAIGGWEYENAGVGNPPIFSRAGTMDVLCALNCLVGSLAALYHRGATGEAGGAATSLLGVACMTQGETLIKADGALAPYPRLDQGQTGFSPRRRIYQASDGWVAVAAEEPDQDQALCAAFGAASLEALESAALRLTCADLMKGLETRGVAAEIVLRDVHDHLFDDAAHKATQAIVAYEHAECGLIEHPGAFWRFSDAELCLDAPLPPPRLGEHTDQILAELGYSAEQIARFRADGVVAG